MSVGSFANLSSLQEDLAKVANDAEDVVDKPKYCLLELRNWLECILSFLERRHSIPPLPSQTELASLRQGPNQYRINRLPEYLQSRISDVEIGLLHKIRESGNWAAHPEKYERLLTRHNAEKALDNARKVRDWLVKQYGPQPSPRSNYTSAQTVKSSESRYDRAAANARPENLPNIPNTATAFPSERPPHIGSETKLPRLYPIIVLAGFFIFIGAIIVGNLQRSNSPPLQVQHSQIPPIAAVRHQPVPPLMRLEYDGTKIGTLRNGELVVTVGTERSADGAGRIAVATGQYENHFVFSLRADKSVTSSNEPNAKVELRRLSLSTSVPQVILSYFSGGAHCCTLTMIATRDPSGNWQTVDGDMLDGGYGYEFVDLDKSGANLLESFDNSFFYAFACYACSYAPTRINRLVGTELLDVTQNPTYLPFLREQLQLMENRGRTNGALHSNGYLGGWVAAKALVGELDEAWHIMLASYEHNSDWVLEKCLKPVPLSQCPVDQRRLVDFPEALAEHLLRNGYVNLEQVRRLARLSSDQLQSATQPSDQESDQKVATSMTMQECAAKYKAAQSAGTLAGMGWNDFRAARCLAGARPAQGTVATPQLPLTTGGNPVFPKAVSPEYASEDPGKARMHTCLDQYNTNKATNGNAGIRWIQQAGDGYYFRCNDLLKEGSASR